MKRKTKLRQGNETLSPSDFIYPLSPHLTGQAVGGSVRLTGNAVQSQRAVRNEVISSGCFYIFTSPLHPWIHTGHRDGESHRLAQNSSQVSEKFASNRLRPRRRLRRGLAGCPLGAPAPGPTAGTPPVSPRRSGLGRAVAMVTQGDAAPHVPSVRPERGGRAGPVR